MEPIWGGAELRGAGGARHGRLVPAGPGPNPAAWGGGVTVTDRDRHG